MRHTGKKLLAFLIALSVTASLFPAGSLPARAASGAGTEEDPYIVESNTELTAALKGSYDYIRLANDIPTTTALAVERTVTIDLAGNSIIYSGSAQNSVIRVLNTGNLTLKDSSGTNAGKITKGKTSLGAGVHIIGGVMTMEGGTITDNTATSRGAGVCINSYTPKGASPKSGIFNMTGGVISNNGSSSITAGGVYVYGGTFNMSGTAKITGNTAKNGAGVFVSNANSFNMTGGEISGNNATNAGGGVYVYMAKGNFALSGGTVTENTAVYGAGVYIHSGGELDTSDPETTPDISGSEEGEDSGSNPGGEFSTSGGVITKNRASSSGGGVYVSNDGTLAMNGGQITDNWAGLTGSGGNGGGVYLSAKAVFQIKGTNLIQDNKLGSGEINNVSIRTLRTLTIDGELNDDSSVGISLASGMGSFTTGYASQGNGGSDPRDFFFSDDPTYEEDYNASTQEAVLGRYTEHKHGTDGSAGDTVFKKIANNYSGGILSSTREYHAGSSMVSGSYYLAADITLNKPIVIEKGTVDLCLNGHKIQGDGATGLFDVKAGATLNICDCAGGGSVVGGKAENGGAFHVDGNLTLRGTLISGNSATANGGGIFVGASGSFTAYNVTFTENAATGDGGGIYAAGAVTLESCTFTGNTGNNGGAVYATGTTSLQNGTLTGNTAGGSGGAIYTTGTATIEGGSLTGNTAGANGGAVYAGGTATIQNGTLTGNTATGSGGGVYAAGSVTMQTATLTDNTANENGGAVYVADRLILQSGTVTENRAGGSGGGVYIEGAAELHTSEITGNAVTSGIGGGVYAGGTLSAAGNVKITDNTYMTTVTGEDGTETQEPAANNLYFVGTGENESTKIVLLDAMAGSQVGVSMDEPMGQVPIVFTVGYEEKTGSTDPRDIFTPDVEKNSVWKTDDTPVEGTLAGATNLKECKITLEPGDVIYNTEEQSQTVILRDGTKGDQLMEEGVDFWVEGETEGTEATSVFGRPYQIVVHGIGGYIGEEIVEWTIANASQDAPEGIDKIDETLWDKDDGIIRHLVYSLDSFTMEWRVSDEDAENEEETVYQDVPDGGILYDLKARTYLFRYKAIPNYDASEPTAITIADGIPLVVTFDSQEGSAVASYTDVHYNNLIAKPANPEREEFEFAGWYQNRALTKAWDFGTDTVVSDMTLYAKWLEAGNGAAVSGTVTMEGGQPILKAQLSLMKGSRLVAAYTTAADGTYNFDPVEPGEYSLVVKVTDAAGKTTTSTQLVQITEDGNLDVDLTAGANSQLTIEPGAPDMIVGGLEKLAEQAKAETGDDVVVNMTATPRVEIVPEEDEESGSAEELSPEEAEIQSQIQAIREVAGQKTMEFVDLSLPETAAGETTLLEEISPEVLEVIVLINTSGRQNFTVHRYHEGDIVAPVEPVEGETEGTEGSGPVKTFVQLSERPGTKLSDDGETMITVEPEDGTYFVGDGYIVIYTSKFSSEDVPATYAIGYTAASAGGGSAKASVTVVRAENGTVNVSNKYPAKGETVTLTVKPDEGYKLASLTVADKQGNPIDVTQSGDGTYTFIMPESGSGVNVTASFLAQKDVNDCPRDESCPISDFTDASPDAWYHDGVHYCLEAGIFSGYGNGKFGPNDYATRAQLVQMFWNMAGQPEIAYDVDFEDVFETSYYIKALRWALYKGIVTGYVKNEYAPDYTILSTEMRFGSYESPNREQVLTILYRYAENQGLDVSKRADLEAFDDNNAIATYAREAVSWAVAEEIIQGEPENILGPKDDVTRAQIATILYRYGVKIAGQN